MLFKKTLKTTLSSETKRLTAGLVMLGAIAALTACDDSAVSESIETSAGAETAAEVLPPTELTPTEPVETDTILVSETGFGDATLCTTPEELQAALPNFVVGSVGDGPLVDSQGVEVTDADGNIAFYALSAVGQDKLNLFTTDNPAYQTAEGIGPGVLIETAAEQYGTPELSYNTEAESREFVKFENGPAQSISFRTGSGDEAGIYESEGGYQTTTQYKPEAAIQSIWVDDRSCL